MKKIFSLFAAVLMAVSVMADPITFTFVTNGGSDGSSSKTAIADIFATNGELVQTIGTATKCMQGADGWGLKMGNKDNNGKLSFTLKNAVVLDSIVANASPFSSSENTLKINGTSFTLGDSKGTFVKAKLVCDGTSEVSTITLEGAKRVYVNELKLYVHSNPSDTRTAVNITSFSATTPELTLGGTATTTTTVANDQSTWTPSYTYKSSNINVATVSETGVVTAVADGTAEITVSLNIANDDETWKKGATSSKKITITVTDPTIQNLSTTFDFVNNNYGLTLGAGMSGAYVPENTIVYSDLVNIKIAASSAARYGVYKDNAELRIYKSKNIVFSVPTGCNITKITLSSRENTYHYPAQDGANPIIWTGKQNTVTISFVGSTQVIQTIKVDYETPQFQPVQLTVSTAQYATYYNSVMAYEMPDGLEGITVEGVTGTALNLNNTHYAAGSVVPADEALILHATSELAEATSFVLNPATTSAKPLAANLLKGTSRADQMTIGGDVYYRLSQHEGQVGFYYGAADGAAFKPGANKAYLALPAGAPARFLFNETTALENKAEAVKANKTLVNGQLFILRDGKTFDVMGRIVK